VGCFARLRSPRTTHIADGMVGHLWVSVFALLVATFGWLPMAG